MDRARFDFVMVLNNSPATSSFCFQFLFVCLFVSALSNYPIIQAIRQKPVCTSIVCFVDCCLSSIHEVVSHLGNTHVVLEGPVVAMNRQLPKEHPIYALLQPHLEGTAFINWAAQEVSWTGEVTTVHKEPL